jgi:hypothetical protein
LADPFRFLLTLALLRILSFFVLISLSVFLCFCLGPLLANLLTSPPTRKTPSPPTMKFIFKITTLAARERKSERATTEKRGMVTVSSLSMLSGASRVSAAGQDFN